MNSRIATASCTRTSMTNFSFCLLVLTMVISGCTSTQNVQEPEAADEITPVQPEPTQREAPLANTDWKAMSILGKPAGSAVSTLGFDAEGRVAGNGGCNAYQGDVTLEGNAIEFGMLATTRMMCPPPINGQETVFLEALGLARSWEQSGDILELIDETHAVVVRLTRQ